MALETLGGWDIWHVGQMAFRSYGTCLTACGTNGVYQMASGTSGTSGTNGIQVKWRLPNGVWDKWLLPNGIWDKWHLKMLQYVLVSNNVMPPLCPLLITYVHSDTFWSYQ